MRLISIFVPILFVSCGSQKTVHTCRFESQHSNPPFRVELKTEKTKFAQDTKCHFYLKDEKGNFIRQYSFNHTGGMSQIECKFKNGLEIWSPEYWNWNAYKVVGKDGEVQVNETVNCEKS